MIVKHNSEIDIEHKLINSISITGNKIYYTSAYDNAIYALDRESKVVKKVIGKGIGYNKYRFREPVHCMSRVSKEGKLELIVSDWHNHRVIKYLDYKYIKESGIFQDDFKGRVKSLVSFAKNLKYKGRYIRSHDFGDTDEPPAEINLFKSSFHFIFRLLSWKTLVKVNKPNGTIFHDGTYIFTQKNRNKITFLDEDLNYLKSISLPKVGRLGNINNRNGEIYISVESPPAIYMLEKNLFKEIKVDYFEGFAPFSSININEKYIATISKTDLLIIKKNSGYISKRIKVGAELHGLDYDESTSEIVVSDRLNSKILFFYIGELD